MALALAVAVAVPRDFYTGTNSVRPRGAVATLDRGQTLCVRGLNVPAGTARLRVAVNARGTRPAMTARVRVGNRVSVSRLPGVLARGRERIEFPIPETPSSPESLRGSACLTPGPGSRIRIGGAPGLQADDVPLTLDGRELHHRVALWYLPPSGEKRSVISLLPELLERAARFRPGIVGPWTYYVLLFAVLPGLIYAALRLLATAGTERRRRLPVGAAIFALALVNAGAWALITPAFNAPDESEHFAYAQYFAETGKAIDRTIGGESLPYSTSESVALDGVRLFSSTERADGHPPWLEVDERRWRASNDNDLPRDNGGGYTSAGGPHTPVYYGLLAPAYFATESQSTFSQLTAMRLISALLGALVALCAFLLVRELLPRHPVAAAGAGLIVAFQPMFGFMSGSVNNDMGVNAAAAVLLYLLIRGLRRGLTPQLGVAIGVVLVVTPLVKGTGYALYPAALIALGAMAYRQRLTRGLMPFAAVAGTFVVLLGGWTLLSQVFERPTITTPGGDAPVVGTATRDPMGVISYVWQTFLPRLPFMFEFTPAHQWPAFETYIQRGWGAFGWYAMRFPEWVYVVIAVLMIAVGALAALALWRRRAEARSRLAEILVLAAALAAVVIGVEIAFYHHVPRTLLPVGGRYAFPAITVLATIAVGSAFAVRRRLFVPAIAVLVVLVLGMSYASQVFSLSAFYS